VRENTYPGGATRTRWEVRTVEGRVERHGPFVRFHANGRAALVGQYARDGRVGTWFWYDEEGNLIRKVAYRGEDSRELAGKELASPTTRFRNPAKVTVAEGQLKYDRPHGPWVYRYNNGTPKAEGAFLSGIPHGRWTFYHPSGQVSRVTEYDHGVPDGRFLTAYPNGQEQEEGHMDQGLKEGTWRTWYDNGQKSSEGAYAEDLREGEWRFWDRQGRLTTHARYRGGVKAEDIPLPSVEAPPPPVIPHPERLPFIPRLYGEDDRPIRHSGP